MASESEKYEVLEKIGHGSFGIIRKVRRREDGHILCRKEIAYSKMAIKEREQLQAEFNILSSLNHTNIVQYYHREHLKLSQELYIYMEYCGGGDLGGVIRGLKASGEFATEEFVWRMFSQIVEALYRCHYGMNPPEAGSDLARASRELKKLSSMAALKGKGEGVMILHRDLKPENIFLGEDQSVKLGDFGLSKLMQSHDFASTYVGTPFYMSPEICAAERYTSHSDIWSLGCIMYELCTKEPPFNAKTHLQLVQKIRKGDFKDIPEHYSKDLRNVIASCLRVNPLQRPDAASLLSVPYIWISRKGREMVEFGRVLKQKEEIAARKLKQVEDQLRNVEQERHVMRNEIEATVRREWEVKARLEITEQVKQMAAVELERLRGIFEAEVEKTVQEKLKRRESRREKPMSMEQRALKEINNLQQQELAPQSSVSVSGEEDFPSSTDLTDLSALSLDSPASGEQRPTPTKKSKRAAFARSKTTVESPADVSMCDPSPMSINSLALSPRRNANASAQGQIGSRNIFAQASEKQKVAAAKWEPTLAYHSDAESDEEDGFPDVPSPTRPKVANVARGDPFKIPSRPGLTRHQTTATMQKLNAQPTLFPNAPGAKGAAIRAATTTTLPTTGGLNLPQTQTLPDLPAAGALRKSPSRRLSKIPSSTSLNHAVNESGSPTRLPSKQNAFAGRTLVELAQARAGGRPLSMDLTNTNQQNNKVGSNVGGAKFGPLSYMEPPVWDPERDEMPSPFLRRGTRVVGGLR